MNSQSENAFDLWMKNTKGSDSVEMKMGVLLLQYHTNKHRFRVVSISLVWYIHKWLFKTKGFVYFGRSAHSRVMDGVFSQKYRYTHGSYFPNPDLCPTKISDQTFPMHYLHTKISGLLSQGLNPHHLNVLWLHSLLTKRVDSIPTHELPVIRSKSTKSCSATLNKDWGVTDKVQNEEQCYWNGLNPMFKSP